MAEPKKVQIARDTHSGELLSLPNVIGVGQGLRETAGVRTDEVCLVVLVRRKVPADALEADQVVPKEIGGVRTDVIEIGEVRALPSRSDRQRPAVPGLSLGHYQITAGTFGAVVSDGQTGEPLILSNNHVIANSNEAQVGDPILQPAPSDGGRFPEDHLANLNRFVDIEFTIEPPDCGWAQGLAAVANAAAKLVGSSHRLQAYQSNPDARNRVDAALANPIDPLDIRPEVLEIGEIQGVTTAELGRSVRKSGRTTGFTLGEIVVIGATISVNYGPSRRARFVDQIITTPMSAPGDSGSLLVAGDAPEAVGLLFAGSDQATIHNPISAVLEELDVEIP